MRSRMGWKQRMKLWLTALAAAVCFFTADLACTAWAAEQIKKQVEEPAGEQAEESAEEQAERSGGGTEQAEKMIRQLYARSAVLIDGDTGRVLVGKDEETVRPMASTTKIMTCILALEQGDLEDQAVVSSYAACQPKVHLGAPAGKTFFIKDLLYSLMLESHNDSAVVIAETIGGSVPAFAEKMNAKARELGCENTCFITPNGLDASVTAEDGTVRTHGTTARDLASIMGYCVWKSPKRDEFLKITQTQNYFFTDCEGKGAYSCVNHNALLTMMEGVVSGKTGFTGGAGYSYVAALEDGGRHFAIALLGCGWPPHKTYKWSDARALFAYGKEHYELREVYREPELKPVRVRNGIPGTEDLGETAVTGLSLNKTEDEKTLKLLMREDEDVTVQVQTVRELSAPVPKGTRAGEVTYWLDGAVIASYPIFTTDPVEAVTLPWCVKKIRDLFLFSQES